MPDRPDAVQAAAHPAARDAAAPGAGTPRRRGAALGAVAAQFSQALGSLLLTAASVRALSDADFGVLSLLLGLLVLATALMTGFVGDSLTVLDRTDPRVRGGLLVWTVLLAAGLLVVGAGGTAVAGLLPPGTAVVFGLALAAFVVEDLTRRLLLARLRSWSVVAVDLVHLASAAGVLGVALARPDPLGLSDVLGALLVGQLLAGLTAVALLPADERRTAPWRGAAVREIAAFGGWRAFQQGVRPASLTLLRVLVLGAAGSAALGGLEAARVYMSPALLLVQGAGGFLLVTYALDRQQSPRQAVRTADRAARTLVGLTVTVSVLAVAAVPLLGPVLTGDDAGVGAVAVAGWGLYAASVAATLPYASLSAVRGRQVAVVGLRLVDAGVSLTGVLLLVALVPHPAALTPYALAVGGLTGAVLQRRLVLGCAAEVVPPAAAAEEQP